MARTALMTATLLRDSDGSSSRYAPLVLEHLYELDNFHDGLCAQLFEQVFI
jgi:hypothetical protein